ncbi:MAG TPA: PEP/pyruvate-binding domain-containing protein, partial [Patescibacteria group bacterium]|nr:PEP/pyruvate-binding domain-containing protein [Patescibacteria group bacterium]
MRNIVWFREVDKDDIGLVGGKGANLGELTRAGLPVPPGFIVTAEAYLDFLKRTGLDSTIRGLLERLDVENNQKLNSTASEIQKAILAKDLPMMLQKEISSAYQKLYTTSSAAIYVAVRSSATAEDLPSASFAGQQKTFLNVAGVEEVIRAVRRCWASLFEPRAIYYRTVHHFEHMKVGIAVPIQKMIQSEKSGIMFTVDPLTSDKEKIVIEAGWGLGEAIVSGSVTPDRYVVDKEILKILEKKIEPQAWKIVKVGKENIHKTCTQEEKKAQKLTDEEIIRLAEFGRKIEDHYQFPQDTEWAIENGQIYFVQSRPVTAIQKTEDGKQRTEIGLEDGNQKLEILLKGIAASIGIASGPVKIIQTPAEIDRILEGDVLVTEKTSPDFVPAMKKSAAIVTETGGQTSHAAIVSRELGIPCVVGTGTATHVLKAGQVVSVDGAKGFVYRGKINRKEAPAEPNDSGGFLEEVPVTATKVYVNLGEPTVAEKVA